ncbi:Domain of unknown function DUF2061, membrane [uncultured Caudovirales phage]|uniref:DUF2061 domain-containing protein n=1 Tax=uncultured Caudovirales phage TaxID=2100421 RepID=A0A6J5TAC8_9CAUD|nr:Domain of unknown function DUF2061, membrane [uncultured Caudovirales phage]
MTKFTETHARTVTKTLTVRVLFTLSHLLNGFIVTGALALSAQIAGVATLINMFLFWAHERVWNYAQWNRKPGDTKMFVDGQPRTISKSITWRGLITCSNFLIPYFMTGSMGKALAFLTIATILNIVVYYCHERAWNRVTWGKKEIVDNSTI